MKYGSVCTGIEAAAVAWTGINATMCMTCEGLGVYGGHPCGPCKGRGFTGGWEPAFFSEIEKFPCELLKHHYPEVPNLGDLNKYRSWTHEPIDLLVGGTPCQSFSVAGLRKGLDDPRGNLALVFLGLVDQARPRWVVWENVPGVLSSGGGRDFGAFLGGLAELGYGFAYRVLDAQYFGVAQRRRRVFVVGYLGDWRPAAAVLFERASLQGDPAPRRQAGQRAAAGAAASFGGNNTAGPIDVATAVNAKGGSGRQDFETETFTVCPSSEVAKAIRAKTGGIDREDMHTLSAQPITGALQANGKAAGSATQQDAEQGMLVTHTLRAEHDASEDGTGRGVLLVPTIALHPRAVDRVNAGPEGKDWRNDGASFTMDTSRGGSVLAPIAIQDGRAMDKAQNGLGLNDDGTAYTVDTMGAQAVAQPMAFKVRGGVDVDSNGKSAGKGFLGSEDKAFTLAATQDQWLSQAMAVRRLTPRECERLQGFPDDYTNVPFRGKPAADGPRYKALGNSMAVPVMAWIGKRIQMVQDTLDGGAQ